MIKDKHTELCEMLIAAGFESGWVLQGETIVLWEHDADPPKPLTRPSK